MGFGPPQDLGCPHPGSKLHHPQQHVRNSNVCLETFSSVFFPHTCTLSLERRRILRACDFTSSLLQVWCVQLTCSHSQIPPVNSGHSTTGYSWSLFILHGPPSPAELMGGMVIRISALGQRCVVLRLFWKDEWRRSDLPLCINRAAVTAGFVIAVAVHVKKKTLKSAIFSSPCRCELAVVAWVCLRQQLLIQNFLRENTPRKAKHQIWPPGALVPKPHHQLGGTGYL